MLACDHDGVRPGIVLLGKALSGGGKRCLSSVSGNTIAEF